MYMYAWMIASLICVSLNRADDSGGVSFVMTPVYVLAYSYID